MIQYSVKEPTKWAREVKALGHEILVVYQPITDNIVRKKFYITALNVMSANVLMKLAQDRGIQTKLHVDPNFPIDFNRNNAVDTAIDTYLADYMFFMDTDQTFPSDTLINLFEHISDKNPIVAGMYYKKNPDYAPVVGRYVDWTPEYKAVKGHLKSQGFVDRKGRQTLYWTPIHYFHKDKPFQADIIGAGCMLVKTSIFKKLKRPYFRYAYDPLLKDPALNKVSEDMYFCAQLKDAGIPILIDPRVQCGHLTELEVNDEICENYRESALSVTKQKDPKKYDEIMGKLLDVRKEQEAWSGA